MPSAKTGGAFCAGADLKAIESFGPRLELDDGGPVRADELRNLLILSGTERELRHLL